MSHENDKQIQVDELKRKMLIIKKEEEAGLDTLKKRNTEEKEYKKEQSNSHTTPPLTTTENKPSTYSTTTLPSVPDRSSEAILFSYNNGDRILIPGHYIIIQNSTSNTTSFIPSDLVKGIVSIVPSDLVQYFTPIP
ncbi:unnamed protein product [Cunninghamella echinulata]